MDCDPLSRLAEYYALTEISDRDGMRVADVSNKEEERAGHRLGRLREPDCGGFRQPAFLKLCREQRNMFEVTSAVVRVCLLMFLRSSASLCPFRVECGFSTGDDRGVSASLKRSLGIRDLRSLGGACLPIETVCRGRGRTGLLRAQFLLERKMSIFISDKHNSCERSSSPLSTRQPHGQAVKETPPPRSACARRRTGPRLGQRRAASSRISGCGEFAFFLLPS
jgi:hypothetical protein